jgi:hypothetical protein
VIRVLWTDGRPHWEVNGAPVATMDQVRRTLAALVAIKADAPVIVHPDPEVPLGHVIDLYDITRLEGFPKSPVHRLGRIRSHHLAPSSFCPVMVLPCHGFALSFC